MSTTFDVVELPPCSPPAIGDTAPSFERPLITADGWRDATLASLTAESPVLLLFHPMLGSFPATYLWQEVADRGWADRFGVIPVGVSISSPYDARRFIAERQIDGSLFSDPANDIAREYDIVHDLDGMAGLTEPRPAVFVIDRDGTVIYGWWATQWPSFPDYDEVEKALSSVTAV